MSGQNILITGSSRGFGQLTVKTLIDKGHTVIASMRDIEGKNKSIASQMKDQGAHVVEIDVTKDESVKNGIKEAIDLAGKIDTVINNAGVGVLGLQECFTPDSFKRLFDINVFGVQRINQAILPHMRSNKNGLIIYVSSLLGRMTIPFYGPYNASKWALEALAENYRCELSNYGIDNCIVEPGGFPTSFFESLIAPDDESQKESYGEYYNAPQEFFKNFEQALSQNTEQNPQNVADAILNLIETPKGERAFRTVVDKMGMGEHIQKYNEHSKQMTEGIYKAFGIDDMLKLK